MIYTPSQIEQIKSLLKRKYSINIIDHEIVSINADELNSIDPDDNYIYFGTLTIISGENSIVCKVLPPALDSGEETIFDNIIAAGAGIPTTGEYHNIFFNRTIPSSPTEGSIKFDGYKLSFTK